MFKFERFCNVLLTFPLIKIKQKNIFARENKKLRFFPNPGSITKQKISVLFNGTGRLFELSIIIEGIT